MKSFLLVPFLVASISAFPSDFQKNDSRIDNRIVGGRWMSIYDVPWQVSVQYNKAHICGGSIISDKYIVTAAHCTDGFSPNLFSVRVGTSFHEFGINYKVSSIYQHPKYFHWIMGYDISIIKLKTVLTFGLSVAPVSLPPSNTKWNPGTLVLITGWGKTHELSQLSSYFLQGVSVEISSEEYCKKIYGEYYITNRVLCAGVPEGGKSACQGDSGGPLVVGNVLAGIVSWGVGCARPGFPGVYTNVSAVRDFIEQITGI
ncbi:trypsin-1-like [Tribolium madens]|uniref:trypsin-1-like n=1 Tax=Tribolium madens TaxID=41895 RepID=UPI001CF744A9|nr:trypsin-1-like [Tribolium madens]